MDPFQGSLFSALDVGATPEPVTTPSDRLTLLALNVQSPSPQRGLRIARRLLTDAPHVIVLSELKTGAGSAQLMEELELGGYNIVRPHGWQKERFHVAIAAHKLDLESVETPLGPRIVAARLSAGGRSRTLCGVYAPTNGMTAESSAERRDWQGQATRTFAQLARTGDLLVLGDLNVVDPVQSGHLAAFQAHDHAFYHSFAQVGLCDVYVAKNPARDEYSWYSDRFGNQRLDHAFIDKKSLSIVHDCHFDHSFRADGLSDHSALIVTLSLTSGDNR